jgi:hypothetical protein
MTSRQAWIAGFLLFLVIGLALYALRANAIAVFLYLLVFALILTLKSRGRLQNFGLAATSVLTVLSAAEMAAMLREPRLVSATSNLDGSAGALAGHRPIVGWGPTAAGRYRVKHFLNGKLVYDAVYTIDRDLLRKVDSGSGAGGVAFLGDSFIFGEGLDDSDTLPQQFANLEGRKSPVYNLGYSAYSPAQALAEMQAALYDKQLKNSRLFVEFLAPWQAERVSCKAPFAVDAPRYAQDGGQVVRQGTCPRVPESPLSYFAIYRFAQSVVPVVRYSDIAIFLAVMREVIHLAHEKYKVPIVVYYLRAPLYLRWLPDWNDDKIMQNLRAAGAEVLEYDFPRGPKFRIDGDGHPTRLANTNCARKLFDSLREKFPHVETAVAR